MNQFSFKYFEKSENSKFSQLKEKTININDIKELTIIPEIVYNSKYEFKKWRKTGIIRTTENTFVNIPEIYIKEIIKDIKPLLKISHKEILSQFKNHKEIKSTYIHYEINQK